MNRVLVAALLAAASACSPGTSRDFEFGLIGPLGPGVESSARAAGMSVRAAAPAGAATYPAGVPSGRVGEVISDWARLRLLFARAVVERRAGAFFTWPQAADGREAADSAEEWQALARVAGEWSAMRPILADGADAAVPFPVPEGISTRAWRRQGRVYVLLVNLTSRSVAMAEEPLRPWRALFEVRVDPRDLLDAGAVPPGRVLWLEGRL